MTRVVHVGIVPIIQNEQPSIDGHSDPTVEHELRLPISVMTAWVSGSWGTWGIDPDPGEQDRQRRHGNLHVAITVPDPKDWGNERVMCIGIRNLLVPMLGPTSRLLDYSVVSDAEWSENHTIII